MKNKTLYSQKKEWLHLASLFLALLCISEVAFAATPPVIKVEAFDAIWTTIAFWIHSGLGRLLCGLMMLIGFISGVAKQDLTPAVVGIGGGLALYNLPSIVSSLIPH